MNPSVAPGSVPPGSVPPGSAARPRRAAPLSLEERRASVLAAAVPLLLERGLDVSTRDLATAAGVAEGTLFRVFPDKASLVRAAVGQALDPTDLVEQIAAAHGPDLRRSLTLAVATVLDRGRTVSSLLAVVHQLPRGTEAGADEGRHHHPAHGPVVPGPGGHGPAAHGAGRHPAQAIVEALTALLEPHAAALRQPPAVCARLVVAVALGAARPGAPDPTLPAAALVDLLLDGLLAPSAPHHPETSC